MMADFNALRKQLNELGRQVVAEARNNLDRFNVNTTGNLSKSLRYDIRQNKDGFILSFGASGTAAKYAEQIDSGRGPTRQGGSGVVRPAIRQWIINKRSFKLRDRKGRFVSKTSPAGQKALDSASYLIARRIHQKGHRRGVVAGKRRPSKYYTKATDKIQDSLAEIQEAVKQDVTSRIRKAIR